MSNEEVNIPDERRELFEALGLEGVVAEILQRGGEGLSPGVKVRSAWVREERDRLERRANLRFWIPQAIAILASVVATIAVFGGGS